MVKMIMTLDLCAFRVPHRGWRYLSWTPPDRKCLHCQDTIGQKLCQSGLKIGNDHLMSREPAFACV